MLLDFFSRPRRLPGEVRRRFAAAVRLNTRPASGELIFHQKDTRTFGWYFGGWHYMPRRGHIKFAAHKARLVLWPSADGTR